MKYRVVSAPPGDSDVAEWTAYLVRDAWDDWGKFCTQFTLVVFEPTGEKHLIGQVKIGERGLKPHGTFGRPPGHRKPSVPKNFELLGEKFFSLGQDEEYYQKLGVLGDELRGEILCELRDVAWDEARWEWAKNETVTEVSLLRSVTRSTVEGQFRRMAQGNARVTKFDFKYTPPKLGDTHHPQKLTFKVDPRSTVPTNVHVLIGRNGVGKTRLLSLMAWALAAADSSVLRYGRFALNQENGASGDFANVVLVSFSAFDETAFPSERKPQGKAIGFSFIGLRRSKKRTGKSKGPKSPRVLAVEFSRSMRLCRVGSRRRRWEDAIRTLQSDPVFAEANLFTLLEARKSQDKEADKRSEELFQSLSSGHKIVLLTLTRLIEKVEERTLVLVDEPEAHLHPPLLSAMTRALSELLVRSNGVAIVATHSPIVLQEVPKSTVWILNRIGRAEKVERPTIETFAENVGVLTREVFGLELSRAGYHSILGQASDEASSYAGALEQFDGQVGGEGRAVLMAMQLTRQSPGDSGK